MAQLSALNSAAEQATPSNVPSQFSKMSSEDFVRIIFTELSNQDPFQPNDSAALLQQLNSIRSIESDLKLTTQLQSLVTQNQLASAGNMIGKFIGGVTADNQRVAGFVISVSKQGENVNLELDNGWTVPMGGVEQVIDPTSCPTRPPRRATPSPAQPPAQA
jgi:flagellar basal-body rod modification protein FlgD